MITRSKSGEVQKDALNISYECVTRHEEGVSNDTNKFSTDELVLDLKNKLAASHSLNNELNEEIINLKDQIKSQRTELFILNGQVKLLINARPVTVIQKDSSTQTTGVTPELVQGDAMHTGTQTSDDHGQLVCSELRADLELSCEDSERQVCLANESVSDIVTHNQVVNDLIPVIKETEGDDISGNCSVVVGELNICNEEIIDLQSCVRSDRIEVRKNTVFSQSSASSRVLLVSDETGCGMSECLRQSLPSHYSVSSLVKSGGNFAYIMKDINHLARNLTMSDHVVLMMGSRHATENTYRYLKGGIRKLMSNCSNTNVLVTTIPYGYSDYGQNDMIYRINQYIEENLFRCKNKFCVYTNKILFKEDYNNSGFILKQSGKQKFATFLVEYILGKRTDDRHSEALPQLIDADECFLPASSGSTSIPIATKDTGKNIISVDSKNKESTKKGKLKKLLKKLISLLE